MPEGPLGGPRPLTDEKEVFIMFRIGRGSTLTPRELEIQQGISDILGPTVDELDINIETLEDGDVIASFEVNKGQEISVEQMSIWEEFIEDELNVNVRSTFIQVS